MPIFANICKYLHNLPLKPSGKEALCMHPLPIIVQKSSHRYLKAFGGRMDLNQKQFIHDEILLYTKCVKLKRKTFIHSLELLRSLFNMRARVESWNINNCCFSSISKLSSVCQHQDVTSPVALITWFAKKNLCKQILWKIKVYDLIEVVMTRHDFWRKSTTCHLMVTQPLQVSLAQSSKCISRGQC